MSDVETNLTSSAGNVWCHFCVFEAVGSVNTTGEISCSSCQGTFVENLGQGIEAFIGGRNEGPTTGIPSTTPLISNTNYVDGAAPGNESIQNILGRILGMGIQVGPAQQASLLDVVQQAAAESGRPVEIVVRQASTPADLNTISSLLGIQATSNLVTSQNASNTTGTEVFPTRQGIRVERAQYLDLIESMLGGPLLQRRADTGGMPGGIGSDLEQILHHILMNEQSRAGTPPASEELISALTVLQVSADSHAESLGECLISFEKFKVGDEAVVLPCGHAYVPTEIKKWLRMHSTCPCCRVIIDIEMLSTTKCPISEIEADGEENSCNS